MKPTYHARLDRAIVAAFNRYIRATTSQHMRGERVEQTYHLWWRLLDLHDRSGFWVYRDCITFGGEDA